MQAFVPREDGARGRVDTHKKRQASTRADPVWSQQIAQASKAPKVAKRAGHIGDGACSIGRQSHHQNHDNEDATMICGTRPRFGSDSLDANKLDQRWSLARNPNALAPLRSPTRARDASYWWADALLFVNAELPACVQTWRTARGRPVMVAVASAGPAGKKMGRTTFFRSKELIALHARWACQSVQRFDRDESSTMLLEPKGLAHAQDKLAHLALFHSCLQAPKQYHVVENLPSETEIQFSRSFFIGRAQQTIEPGPGAVTGWNKRGRFADVIAHANAKEEYICSQANNARGHRYLLLPTSTMTSTAKHPLPQHLGHARVDGKLNKHENRRRSILVSKAVERLQRPVGN
ncbi:hypothetical protein QBC42DRAFT_347972 [Cladorrhinum samala]|uniref:Uncharacterized protein n=1 Tax=Cladorrhinum samala TaxID=585594 RepID=A0AAV9HHY2_9PEZI|nr:hypothetical protein QBC42DRAFT_347972 [Cladorrhinum samala]